MRHPGAPSDAWRTTATEGDVANRNHRVRIGHLAWPNKIFFVKRLHRARPERGVELKLTKKRRGAAPSDCCHHPENSPAAL
jgi:hypothetical protein